MCPTTDDGPATSAGRSTDSADPVVIPTGGGRRFHRPGWLVFETACKTEFGSPVRETSETDAVADGFTPCERPACFGARA